MKYNKMGGQKWEMSQPFKCNIMNGFFRTGHKFGMNPLKGRKKWTNIFFIKSKIEIKNDYDRNLRWLWMQWNF